MGNHHPSNHQPLERGNVGKFGDVTTRRSLRSPRKMDRLRRSFRDSFRRRKERMPESSKPHQWQADESAVRSGTCTFTVKYLGCVEVFESRGMQVCEEAIKVLRGSRRRPVRAILHVSGDGLRVVEEETKGLIVDQTIEKVSFCAPDRNHDRGFSYICRDGTTRRWMCHGFLALRESGERLSHAVGCAFAVCLERKQRRDKECAVTMTFDTKNSTFTRTGSFRQHGLTERLERAVDVGSKAPPVNPFAIERPHATASLLARQGSCRGIGIIGQNSPFKRQMSLRVNDLPSNTERLNAYRSNGTTSPTDLKGVSPIPEISPGDSVTALCQQLSQGLSQLTHSNSDDFNFNNQLSVNQNQNQNNLTVTVTNTTINFNKSLTSSPTLSTTNTSNSFTQSISSTPAPSLAKTITPVNLNFNQTYTPAKPSPNPSVGSNASLPKPDQWLGQIVNLATPSSGVDGIPPRSKPSLSAHSRAMSLDSAATYSKSPDPFDAEWAALAARQNTNSTNPFLSNSTSPQAFQVRL
ncbi:hypothetical protein PPYR_12230 [Photinus pyralis]|uniref:PID domain-containing protein n=2 Tax=Photinus pyralis TaxID=7054 RepID=A0A1Y1N494_PHOPY|nr:protein numb isoform X1 [Photinus pyralis]KAB0795391.1 hypothetical protein PPYR_12230 [Photinus pyralis]